MDESDWVSAHAFYHGDLDLLVTEGIAPLAADLDSAGALRRWFFLRYWEGGPHARLRLLPEPGHRARVERAVLEGLAEYFRALPSREPMRRDRYLHMASYYARRERMETFETDLRPDNSVALLPYRREYDRYGGASDAVERHFAESSRIAVGLLAEGTAPEQRTTAAFAAVLLAWLVAEPDLGSLAERVGTAESAVPRSTDLLGLGGTPPTARREQRRDQAIGVARGLLPLAAHAGDLPRTGTFVDWTRSALALRAGVERTRAGASDPDPFQVLDTCAHLFCNRIGVLLNSEDEIRGAAAEAVGALAAEQEADGEDDEDDREDRGGMAQPARRVLRE
ncbi:lantibiotic dehydratase C-terminal domain-containing protein [Streptomonospora wellingtoniae]|uniref:Lantibiotic dehydratase C-terminal domain-containing protein n=1 Tax=Streptomonospora wellingtoniae TaxID=3075544 RepID=A0ABU2L066_9ACTN|nr:lantibiotic dehydratase C-terminal domain-containing protein [Streptomonospora sp. DSM 45055]MDT0304939.1 lantibiotic dehydratase C-terminal domain-containing protein [Streptomonospora sp. DSM 45055]